MKDIIKNKTTEEANENVGKQETTVMIVTVQYVITSMTVQDQMMKNKEENLCLI